MIRPDDKPVTCQSCGADNLAPADLRGLCDQRCVHCPVVPPRETPRADLGIAVSTVLVLLARLAGGPWEPTEATAQWAATRLVETMPEGPSGPCAVALTTVEGVRYEARATGYGAALEALMWEMLPLKSQRDAEHTARVATRDAAHEARS